MIKSFCVAGHCFQLRMPDGLPLWNSLSQYSPFEVDAYEDVLFQLDTVDSLPEKERVPLLTDDPVEADAPKIALYDAGDSFYIEMSVSARTPVCGLLLIGKNLRHGMLKILGKGGASSLFALNNSLMIMYAFSTAVLGTLEMHSSVIMNGGRGYLFLGRSGTGKSTHSSLWLKHIEGSELLNDDNPVMRVLEDGSIRVYGTPWSGKTPCYRNLSVPVGAVVRIKQAPFNRITRQNILESYASIYSSCSGFKADESMAEGLHGTLEKIVLNVPCYTLECLPDEAAAVLCASTVKTEGC